ARANTSASGVCRRRTLRDAVVLHDEQHRYTPDRGEIQALVQQALAERAVPDERRRHTGALSELAVQSFADRDRGQAGLNAGAVESSCDQMLAAAGPLTDTVDATHDFGDQAEEVARECQEVAVVSMIRDDAVVRIREGARDRHLAEFLTDARMRSARHEIMLKQIENRELTLPDQA